MSITCPFCGEDGFDEVGLHGHLTGNISPWTYSPCKAYEAAESDASWEAYQAAQNPQPEGGPGDHP